MERVSKGIEFNFNAIGKEETVLTGILPIDEVIYLIEQSTQNIDLQIKKTVIVYDKTRKISGKISIILTVSAI
jgi:hypothetical protein